tara:strand:+ start:10 stop:201 length:192 start_codon:yes stop_codon:yes gene_type:complete
MTEEKKISDNQNFKNSESLIENSTTYVNYTREAEKANGRWAMLGIVALVGAYLSTGQIIPGIY